MNEDPSREPAKPVSPKPKPRRAAARSSRPPAVLAAYVLHRHDWSESSLIVDAFTRELGRVVLVARGAKRPYSQLRPVLLPFQRLALTVGRTAAAAGGGEEMPEIHTLRTAEWAGSHPQPRGSALFAGFYLHELLIQLLARHDPHPGLFDAYARAVALLADGDERRQAPVLRAFECRLLRETGLLPALDHDTLSGEAVAAGAVYAMHPELGVTARPAGTPGAVAGRRLRALEAALAAGDFDALVAAAREGDTDLKPALRALLQHHLQGARLRTRELLRDLAAITAHGARGPASAAPGVRPNIDPPPATTVAAPSLPRPA